MFKKITATAAILSALTAPLLAVTPQVLASAPFVANPSPLVAGQAATITVDNTIPKYNMFIVMPGTDLLPQNGSCTTHLHYSAGYLPNNAWHCTDLSAPIVFSTPALASKDLQTVPYANLGMVGTGWVGFIGTGGMSRGAWTLSSPTAKYLYTPAENL